MHAAGQGLEKKVRDCYGAQTCICNVSLLGQLIMEPHAKAAQLFAVMHLRLANCKLELQSLSCK